MIDRNWPAMFRDPFSQLAMDSLAQGAYGAGYAQGLAAGMQAAQLAAGGCYGPQQQMPFGPEAALDFALQRFFAQAGMDPTAGLMPQPGLAYGLQQQMQQMNQMGALGAAQGLSPEMSPQMAQDFQLLIALIAFAMIVGQRNAGGVNNGGGCWGGGRVFGNNLPGPWGQQQRVPGGWDGRPGWGQNIPDYIPQGNAPGGTALGNQLAMCAANVADRRGTVGWCFAGAKESIARATGVRLEGGSAYMAANQLAQSGRFREVSVSPDQLRRLPAGAVVVWGQTNVSPHGHISVALGDGREASDHVQRQMTSLRGHTNYRVFLPA